MAFGPGDLLALQRLLRAKAGIVLTEDDHARIEQRLAPLAKAHGLTSVASLLGRIRLQPWSTLHSDVIQALLEQAPSFLVDHALGRELIERVLPRLILARSALRRLRLWCPLAGSGQGPASLALLLLEHFPAVADWDIVILASDRSATRTQDGGDGISYSPVEVVQGLPTQVLLRRFRHQDGRWQLKPEAGRWLRRVDLDLRGEWPQLEAMDLIVVRQTLPYLSLPEQSALVLRLRSHLVPDGELLLDADDAAALARDRTSVEVRALR